MRLMAAFTTLFTACITLPEPEDMPFAKPRLRAAPALVAALTAPPLEKSAAAAVLEGHLLPDNVNDRNRAVLEVLAAIKERSYNRALESADITDPEVMQKFLLEKQKLEELKRGGLAIGG